MNTAWWTGFVMILATMSAPAAAQLPPNVETARPGTAALRSDALDRLAFRPDVVTTAGIERQLDTSDVPPAAHATATSLRARAADAVAAGQLDRGMRMLYQAIAKLTGRDWAKEAFVASLKLDPATPVADRDASFVVTVRGMWRETPPHAPLQAHATIVEDRVGGQTLADLGVHMIAAADWVGAPPHVTLPLDGVAPGQHRLALTIARDGGETTTLFAALDVVDGLHRHGAAVDRRLARIAGHDNAKATIAYPFRLAAAINAGQREVLSYDFAAEIARSGLLLDQLEAGHDPIVRATGDLRRAYINVASGATIPFRLYVPRRWKPGAALPLMVFLHGANLDENDGLTRGGGIVEKLAEERGFIVVAPLGYRLNSAYGAALPPVAPHDFGLIATPDPSRNALSERDVIAVTERIAREYGTDRRRTYLTGNSMGGMGTWHLAATHPGMWAAIAPAAGGVNAPDFAWGALRGLPILAITGDHDFARPAVLATVDAARRHGLAPKLVVVPGGTHGSSIERMMPTIFDLFDGHPELGRADDRDARPTQTRQQ